MAHRTNVLPGLIAPTTKSLREAVRNIILDIQKESGETDHETAERLGISVGTLRNARDRRNDLGSLTIAKIGYEYGDEAIAPYAALWAIPAGEGAVDPIGALADALSAISRAKGPKAEMDALPAAKDAVEAVQAWILDIERKRLRAVA